VAYSRSLSYLLQQVQIPDNNDHGAIDKYMGDTISAIHEATRVTIPVVQFQGHQKPYWNGNLKELHKDTLLENPVVFTGNFCKVSTGRSCNLEIRNILVNAMGLRNTPVCDLTVINP
jgi:hypothetical protein